MQKKKWILLSKSQKREEVLRISETYGIPPVIATVILNRGIENPAEYIAPDTEQLKNPFIMKGMEQATDRILRAIETHEHITVYGDYDVDGITSTAALVRFLKEHHAEADYYIPDRLREGYGVNNGALAQIAKQGTSLLITVDCGITAVNEVEYAKQLGMDVIITDHHECKEELPNALCILNPKQPDCPYPFKKLAGVGVVFKLLQAITLRMKYHMKELLEEYLGLVAVGTVADVMPLVGENRIIVRQGMASMKYTVNRGLRALIEQADLDAAHITAGTIGFTLAPRINAAGRMGDPRCAVEMLLADDESTARRYAQKLSSENKQRQETESEILKDADALLKQDEGLSEDYVMILHHEGWHHGIIGIVASKISERFHKPCILISTGDGMGKGSGRSIPAFNLFHALEHCSEELFQFGGHELAAGLSVETKNIESFRKKINEYAKNVLTEDDFVPVIAADTELPIRYVNMNTAEKLSILEPHGMGNPKPVFYAGKLRVVHIKALGEGKHIKLTLSDGERYADAVGFQMGDWLRRLRLHDMIDILYHVDINIYRGIRQVQIILKDMRFSEIREEKGGETDGN